MLTRKPSSRSIKNSCTTTEGGQSALPIPAIGPHLLLDRVTAATPDQLRTALIFLSAFSPDAFDYAMDAVESEDENHGATGEAEPGVQSLVAISASSWSGASTGSTMCATARRSANSKFTTQATLPQ
jgi:hypothetical protein